MRKLLVSALLVGCMTTPAHAVVGFVMVGNLTYSELFFNGSQPPWEQQPVVTGPFLTPITLSSSGWDSPFSTSGVGPYFPGCGAGTPFSDPCLIPLRQGNILSFTAPVLGGAYQNLSISLTFDQDIQFNTDAIRPENFVSGSYSWGYAHHNGGASAGGPILYIVGIPEPGSWVMMIGGFAIAGMALRRRPRVARA